MSKKASFIGGNNDTLDSSSPEEFITASIVEHVIKTEEKFPFSKYVIYRIDFTTSIKCWNIWRRYSNFESFREILKKKIINLPELPEKKLFNTSKEIINERKYLLSIFLNFILEKKKILCYPEISEFIEFDKESLLLLCNKQNLEVTNNSLKNIISGIDSSEKSEKKKIGNNYYTQFLEYKLADPDTKTPFMLLINEFLKNLELKPQNKSSIIKTFDSFLKATKVWPSFKTDEIQKLFFGDGDDVSDEESKIKGLLSNIGDMENIYGAEESLYFLLKLIDCEYNPEFEKYISILKTMKQENFDSMNLIHHIESEKSNSIKRAVYKLIDILYTDKKSKFENILIQSGMMKYYEAFISNNCII